MAIPRTDLGFTEDDIQSARAQGRAKAEDAYEAGYAFDPTPEDALAWLDTSDMKLADQVSANIRRALMFELLDASKKRFEELANQSNKELTHG